jgi:hypothetical protein
VGGRRIAPRRPIAEGFRARGIRRFLVQRRRSEGAAAPLPAGLVRYRRNWVKLAGPVAKLESIAPKSLLVIRPARAIHARACGEVFCRGFDLPLAAAELFSAVIGRPQWRVLTALDGDTVAGVGYLYHSGEVAYLAGATTARSHRRRGVQRALLVARLRAAAELGCRLAVSETGEDADGDPQHSLRNMRRLGLEAIGVTENLADERLCWEHGQQMQGSAR